MNMVEQHVQLHELLFASVLIRFGECAKAMTMHKSSKQQNPNPKACMTFKPHRLTQLHPEALEHSGS